ncbi:MAG: DUF5615 family PIN-like protein [Pseudomonadota bacterium]|nr:DUF5615 family PIN-like protein [Pseudomonadota bacterium]
MKLWIDAQLAPALAPWIVRELGIEAVAVKDLGLRDAKDPVIFQKAREADAIVMTKDSDFVLLQERLGPPPKVLWITCGNTSNERMRSLLRRQLPIAMQLFAAGEPLVEISELS